MEHEWWRGGLGVSVHCNNSSCILFHRAFFQDCSNIAEYSEYIPTCFLYCILHTSVKSRIYTVRLWNYFRSETFNTIRYEALLSLGFMNELHPRGLPNCPEFPAQCVSVRCFHDACFDFTSRVFVYISTFFHFCSSPDSAHILSLVCYPCVSLPVLCLAHC